MTTIEFIKKAYKGIIYRIRRKMSYYYMVKQSRMVDPAEGKRPKYWKKAGVDVQGKFNVGYGVYFDAGNAQHIHVGEGAWITARCLILCHKRDLSHYYNGSDINVMPYHIKDVWIGRGAHIGMDTVVMPGVTIGEGAIIGAGSLVTKDIPPYCVAVGRPAKVVRVLEKKLDESRSD